MQSESRLSVYLNKRKKESKHPDLNAIIHLNKSLPAGKYSVGLYSKLNDYKEKYYSGKIIEPEINNIPQSFSEPVNLQDDNIDDIPF